MKSLEIISWCWRRDKCHQFSFASSFNRSEQLKDLERHSKLSYQLKSCPKETSRIWNITSKRLAKNNTSKNETLNLNRKINDFGFLPCCTRIKGEVSEKETAIDFESVEMCKTISNWISARRNGGWVDETIFFVEFQKIAIVEWRRSSKKILSQEVVEMEKS